MPDDALSRISVDFDQNTLDHANNWPHIYKKLRTEHPRAWSRNHGGYWVASKYNDIIAIAQKPDYFTTLKTFDGNRGSSGGVSIPPTPLFRVIPNETEDPEWNHVRKFLNHRFSPKAVEAYRATVKQYAAAMIDRVIEKGEFDIVEDLASPVPALITMHIMGFPLKEWPEFSDSFHKIVALPFTDPRRDQVMERLNFFLGRRAEEEIEKRRKNPRNDMFSYMVTGELDGQPLSRELMQGLAFNIVGGGVDTTTALTSNTLHHLAHNPQDRQRLIDQPDLMPIATEEFLRYFSPIHGLARTCKQDIEINGWLFRKGERLLLAYASANRDEDTFEDPEKLIIDRFPNRHIGFGAGMHRCLGSFLARITFDAMVREVLTRMPDYKIVDKKAEHYTCISITNGWVKLPATFTPGKKVGATVPEA